MIYLTRIYSDTDLFDEVTFRRGLNIVLGSPSGQHSGRELNGVGKSTLVRMIDLAFCGQTPRAYFTSDKAAFLRDHSYVLEFTVKDKTYRIRRDFGNLKSTLFSEASSDWSEYTEPELKDILATLLIVDDTYNGTVDTSWFRSLMRFFIKDDKTFHARIDPVNFVHQSTRKSELLVYNYFLMGLPNQHVVRCNELSKKLGSVRKERKTVEQRIIDDSGKPIEQIRSDVDRLQDKIQAYEKSLSEFTFLEEYKNVETELRDVSTQISGSMREFAAAKRRLEHLRQSYNLKVEVDVAEVKQAFSDFKQTLGDFVEKTLDEVIAFRKDIAANRKKFLAEREKTLTTQIDDCEKQVGKLEERRKKLYKWLEEKQAFDSIKNAYERLMGEREKYERSAALLHSLDNVEQDIAETNAKLSEVNVEIVQQRRECDDLVRSIRKLFFEILENTIYLGESADEAFFEIDPTNQVVAPIRITVGIPKDESHGKSRYKLPVYDLTLFRNIVKQKRHLPHFLVHDGAFNGIDVKTVVKFLNYIERMTTEEGDIQYLVTVNEDQVFVPEKRKQTFEGYEIDFDTCVIANYQDVPEKMIFKREF